VSIRIGTRLPDARSRRDTSSPSMSGSPTSSTTASGAADATWVRASWPSAAWIVS
jgi:hypothetical protein